MRRVVVTGQGIVSSLGNDLADVALSLREGRSGMRFNPTYAERGMRCQVSGRPDLLLESVVDRRTLRFMGDAAAYAWLSMKQATDQAGLEAAQMSHPRTGADGRFGRRLEPQPDRAADTLRAKGIKRVGPFMVTRTHGQHGLGLSGHELRHQRRQLQHQLGVRHLRALHRPRPRSSSPWDQQDVVFAGGGEEVQLGACRCCSMRWARCPPLSMTRPEQASRAVRCGARRFCHRRRRRHAGARGVGARAGARRHHPGRTGGLRRHIGRRRHGRPLGRGRGALHAAGAVDGARRPVDYINTHGTSTPVGDVAELGALRDGVRRARAALSARPSRCRAIRWARPVCRRRSTAC